MAILTPVVLVELPAPVATITLSWPDKQLQPNARKGSSRKAKSAKVKAYWAEAGWLWRQANGPGGGVQRGGPLKEAVCRATFYQPDKYRRDPLNLEATLKPAWDGAVSARILEDDNKLTALPSIMKLDRERPRVVLEIFNAKVEYVR